MPEKVIPAPDVPPFVTFVTSAVPMVFDNSMSYYEALCALWKWLQDDVIDVINNNASVTNDYIDLTNEYIEKFNELKDYVDTYFDNLDVQEEINNKLDAMVVDGTLQTLINNFLQPNVTWTFDTVADMAASTNLVNGGYARTMGYRALDDGGEAIYYISDTGTADGGSVIAVGDLFAHLVSKDEVNIKQFGAYGDDTHDDTTAITNALAYAKLKNKALFIPAGTFLVSNEFTLDFAATIHGINDHVSVIKQTDTTKYIFIDTYSYCKISDLCLNTPLNSTAAALKITATTGHNFDNLISNCQFIGDTKTGVGIELVTPSTYGLMDNTIRDCVFRQLAKGITLSVGSGWINGNKFDNLWFYTTVRGIEWLETSSFVSSSSNSFTHIKGQHSSGVEALVYNVNGADNAFDNMHLWDGGITIQIDYHARFTKITNFTNFEIAKFIDLGFATYVDNFVTDRTRPYWTEYRDNFIIGRNEWLDYMDSSSAATVDVVQNDTACKIVTDATANKYNAIEGNDYCLLGTGKQMLNFSFLLTDLENVKVYLGLETTSKANHQGNFLTYDSSGDGKFHLKAITNESTSTFVGDYTINDITPTANTWYNVQIWRNTDQRLDVWINGEYKGGFNGSQRYNNKPVFYIQTLEGVAKTLAVRNVKVRTYTY